MGRFADGTIEQLTDATSSPNSSTCWRSPDRELLAWITGEAAVPPDYDTALFRRLRDFNAAARGAR